MQPDRPLLPVGTMMTPNYGVSPYCLSGVQDVGGGMLRDTVASTFSNVLQEPFRGGLGTQAD